MFTAYRSFIVLVMFVAIAAAWFLMPNTNEHSSMLIRDGRPVEVISWLEPKKFSGKWQPKELTALARAYVEVGDYDKAIETMQLYVSKFPNVPSALDMLADFYGATGQVDEMLAARYRSVLLAPDERNIASLLAQFRLNNKFDRELELLAMYRDTELLSKENQFRLAQRLLSKSNARKSDLDSAIQILSRIDDESEACADEKCTLLFRLLFVSGQKEIALLRAKKWFAKADQTWLVSELLKQNNMSDNEVIELASAAIQHDQGARFYLVGVMEKRGYRSAAKHVLENWLEESPEPSSRDVAAFISSTRQIGVSYIAFQTFTKILANDQYSYLQTSYTQSLTEIFGAKALAPIMSQLSRNELLDNDLASAQIAIAMNNPDLVLHYLQKVSDKALNKQDRNSWRVLVQAVSNKWKLQNNKMLRSS